MQWSVIFLKEANSFYQIAQFNYEIQTLFCLYFNFFLKQKRKLGLKTLSHNFLRKQTPFRQLLTL